MAVKKVCRGQATAEEISMVSIPIIRAADAEELSNLIEKHYDVNQSHRPPGCCIDL